jgi:tRNA A37 threonylcarbamoyladenosine biosynthesis protein TsaE
MHSSTCNIFSPTFSFLLPYQERPIPSPLSMTIPITVFTGFLGAGKTSVILSLLPKLPKDYKVVLLKNEFGDVEGTALYYPFAEGFRDLP